MKDFTINTKQYGEQKFNNKDGYLHVWDEATNDNIPVADGGTFFGDGIETTDAQLETHARKWWKERLAVLKAMAE